MLERGTDDAPAQGEPTESFRQALDPGPGWGLGPGHRLGAWRLGEVIGRGGSSVVFEAFREDADFEQRAAVKLLRSVVGDAVFSARFERERRILADLEDPRIVRLLDGGTTPDGVPWFAMERVDGVTLLEWCREVPREARLRLVVELARAVDHAHRRLVVHCDLKPDNVLVDRDGHPRVLDFGIARLVGEDERTGTIRVATPRWAAPEQLDGRTVTTAADVYALGLVLWSALTGQAPREELSGLSLLSAGAEPLPPPSRVEPAARGDLDAIVARATAPEPGERDPNAGAFADDLERHLRGEAVRAREGARWYRATRWVRRNRALAGGAAAVVLALVGWGATSAMHVRALEAERARTEASLALLVDVLGAADPAQAQGHDPTVREALRRGLSELDAPGRDPKVTSEVRLAAGEVLAALDAPREAEPVLARAVDELGRAFGDADVRTLRGRLALARARYGLGKERAAQIEEIRRVVDGFEVAGDLGGAGRARLVLAEMLLDEKDLPGTIQAAQEARDALREAGDAGLAARALAVEGLSRIRNGEQEPGEAQMRAALDETIAAVGTERHPDVIAILHELALVARPKELELFERVVRLRREVSGEGRSLATTLNNAGLALEETAPARAAALLAEAADMARRSFGADDPTALRIVGNYGAVLVDTGRPVEALPVLREVVASPGCPEGLRERVAPYLERARQGAAQAPAAPPPAPPPPAAPATDATREGPS